AEQAAQDLAHLDSLSYFPLAIGNWWRWRSTFQHVMRETVIDSLRAGGHLYHRFDQFREFSGAGLRWSNDRELIVREDTSEQVWLKFGAKIGESWRVYGPQRLAEWSVTLESTTDTVTTEAGRFFPCHRFSFKFAGADNDWVEWYALNVGPVKRVLFGFAVIEYVLIGAHLNGKNLPTLVTETPAAPRTLELGQSFPNPFAPDRAASHLRATTISYRLLRPAQVTLTIHDLLGRTINTLVQRRQAPGDYVVTWDGRDQHGARVPGGIYFCRLQAGGSVQTRKLAVIH
ncbi:MAG: hypothetical protein ONB49_16510, partial [candidate division KSB1 bacterium]|nr:hypothetical protein [candidate division KSB1 bacterium]